MQEIDGRTYFYRFTNENEEHNGYQYTDGLNELPPGEPFYPAGTCAPGGLYFVGDAALDWCSRKVRWLRKVEIPDDAQVYKDPDGNKYKADKLFLHPRVPLFSDGVSTLLNDPGVVDHVTIKGFDGDYYTLLRELMDSNADKSLVLRVSELLEGDLETMFMVALYTGDEKKLLNFLDFWPDRLSNILNTPELCVRVSELSPRLQKRIIDIVVVREWTRAMVELYISSPGYGKRRLEKQILNRLEKRDLFIAMKTTVALGRALVVRTSVSSGFLTKINAATDGMLEQVLVSMLVLRNNSPEEEARILAAYRAIGKKQKPAEDLIIGAINGYSPVVAQVAYALRGFSGEGVTAEKVLHALDTLKVTPTQKLVRRENVPYSLPAGILPVWNKRVRENAKNKKKAATTGV